MNAADGSGGNSDARELAIINQRSWDWRSVQLAIRGN
jgi:hypothetical protein